MVLVIAMKNKYVKYIINIVRKLNFIKFIVIHFFIRTILFIRTVRPKLGKRIRVI